MVNAADAEEEDDHELVSLAQCGERDAFDRLMLRHQVTIARHMRRFSGRSDEVEDLTQTVFVNAYQGLAAYRPTAPFINWLKVIANRVGYQYWRREERRVKGISYHGHEDILAEKDDTHRTEVDEQFAILISVMNMLKPSERQTLYLLYVDGMSVSEVARVMGWNQAVTKMRAHRARIKLRKLLHRKEALPTQALHGREEDHG